VGCATKSPPVLVAYGQRVSQRNDINLPLPQCGVWRCSAGHLATNMVELVFWRKTQVGVLIPEQVKFQSARR